MELEVDDGISVARHTSGVRPGVNRRGLIGDPIDFRVLASVQPVGMPPHAKRESRTRPSCWPRPAAATREPFARWSSRTARGFTPTATGCWARFTTPTTRSRRRWCGPGAGSAASRDEARPRTWLHTIATHICLDSIARRPKRVLPIDYGAASEPGEDPGEPLDASVWIEPYPDGELGSTTATPRPRPATSSARRWSWRSSPRFSTCHRASVPRSSCATCSASLRARRPRRSRPRHLDQQRPPARTQDRRSPPPRAQPAGDRRALGDERVREVVERFSEAFETATWRRSSRCWPRTSPSRCPRTRPGTRAATRSGTPGSCPAALPRAFATSRQRQRAAGARHLRLDARAPSSRSRSTCSAGRAAGSPGDRVPRHRAVRALRPARAASRDLGGLVRRRRRPRGAAPRRSAGHRAIMPLVAHRGEVEPVRGRRLAAALARRALEQRGEVLQRCAARRPPRASSRPAPGPCCA